VTRLCSWLVIFRLTLPEHSWSLMGALLISDIFLTWRHW
jgi:hypothetical protein